MLTWVYTEPHHSFEKDADVGEGAEGREPYYKLKTRLYRFQGDYPSFRETNWQQLERDVGRIWTCLVSPTLVFLLTRERTLKPPITYKDGERGKEENPKPLILLLKWTHCSSFPDGIYYLNMSKRSYSLRNIYFPSGSFSPYISQKKKKKMVKGTCVLFVLLVPDIQRVHPVQSTTCVLSFNLWKSFIPRKEYRLFLCHPNGRMSQIPDDEGASEGP